MTDANKGRRLSRLLGWLSTGLGTRQAVSPEDMNRWIGVAPTADANAAMRAVGIQELAVGLAILRSRRPTGWLWTRVLGDLVHLGLLRSALGSRKNDPARLRAVLRGVVVIGLVDVLAARRLGRSTGEPIQAKTTITVNRGADEVYRFWRDLGHLPHFMDHLESVDANSSERSHWVARGPAGKTMEWDAEIVQDVPGELIEWRSVGDADVANAGYVRFAQAPGDRGTEVTVCLQYTPPGGRAGAAAAKLLGENPQQQIRDDLRRFKQVIETGEVVRSDGSPEGLATRRQRKQRRAQPVS